MMKWSNHWLQMNLTQKVRIGFVGENINRDFSLLNVNLMLLPILLSVILKVCKNFD